MRHGNQCVSVRVEGRQLFPSPTDRTVYLASNVTLPLTKNLPSTDTSLHTTRRPIADTHDRTNQQPESHVVIVDF